MKDRSPIAPIRVDLEIRKFAILEIGRFAIVETGNRRQKVKANPTYTHRSIGFEESEPDRADPRRSGD